MAGKIVVVTGASDGIGRATAILLSKSGYFPILISRNEEKLKKVISEEKLAAAYSVCDISDAKTVEGVINKIAKDYGRIDVLINDAGVWIEGELDRNSTDEIKKTFDVNTLGHVYTTRSVIPIMKKQKDGLIINIVSRAGLNGKPERSVYTATKFAITGLTKSLVPELKKYGIKMAGIYPGKVSTDMFAKAGNKNRHDRCISS